MELLGNRILPLRAAAALQAVVTILLLSCFATSANAAPVPAQSVSAGSDFTCAVISGAAKCWGRNDNGENGNGTFATSTTEGHALIPVQVTGLTSGVTAVSAGDGFACAIINGSAKCWGKNDLGQLGNGSNAVSSTPVQVTGLASGVTAISAGYGHTCAVVSGAAKCWGSQASFFGALGNGVDAKADGNYDDSNVPVQVSGLTSGVTAISANQTNSCAIQSGAAKCWGSQFWGQLGNGVDSSGGGISSSPTPVSVTGIASGAAALSGGYEYTCALVSGAASCWGHNDNGQLGTSSFASATTPTNPTDLTAGMEDIDAATSHTCAVVSGAAKCWGKNYRGQLGDGTQDHHYEPEDVSSLASGVTDISAGHSHTCAIVSGFIWCWGSDWYGAIGDGLGMYERDVTSPVQVVDTIPPPEEPNGPIIEISSPTMGGTLTLGEAIHFTVDGDFPIATIKCSLDGQPPVPCSSPWTPPSLSLGSHAVDVIARDTMDVVGMNGVAFTVVAPAPPVTPALPVLPPTKPALGKMPAVLKASKVLSIPVSCATACSLKLVLKIGRKKVTLPTVNVPAGTTSTTPVKVKLSAKIRKQIKAALKARKKVTLAVQLTSSAGTTAPATMRLK